MEKPLEDGNRKKTTDTLSKQDKDTLPSFETLVKISKEEAVRTGRNTKSSEKAEPTSCWGRFAILTSLPVVLVLLSSLVTQLIINGVWRAYGYIYLEFLDLFESGSAETSWVAFTFSISQAVVAPFTGIICDRASIRVVAFCSGILGTISLVATAYCPTITAVIVSYGILLGVSMRFSWVSAVTFINKHFSKHQILANGFMFCGNSFGGISFPFLINYLSSQYAVRGALFIMGGVWLNLCAAGLLFVPSLLQGNPHLTGGNHQITTQKHTESGAMANGPNTIQLQTVESGKIKKIIEQDIKKAEGKSCCSSILTSLRALLTIKYITSAMLWYAVTTGMHSVSQFLPVYAKEHGWSKDESSTLMAVMYSCDLIARILYALLGDLKKINKSFLLASVLIICGSLTILFSFFTNNVTFYIYAVVHGLFGDAIIVFLGYTITSSIGREHVGLGLGVISVLFGLSGMATAALVGHVQEYSRSYVSFLYLTGSLQISGAIIYLLGKYGRCINIYKTDKYVIDNENNKQV